MTNNYTSNSEKSQYPLVSVIILSFNEKRFKEKFLDSLKAQTYPNIETIVIDNASGDDSVERIRKWMNANPNKQGRTYDLVINKSNTGFAAGQNQGIHSSKGEYVMCLNQDAWLDKDFIKNAVEVLEKDKKAGVIQGKLIRFDFLNDKILDIIDTTGLLMLKNRRIINRDQGVAVNVLKRKETEEVFGSDGAAPIYRREALNDVKLPKSNSASEFEYFDEDFFLYKEDVDLAWRLRLYGWKTFYAAKCIGYHGRGAGDSAATNSVGIVRERMKIPAYAKYYSWKNQRLMQIKNESMATILRHMPWLLPKEIASWLYVLILEEPHAIKSIWKMFVQMPIAFKKRKIIMSKKRISEKEMEKWFN